jgi:glutamate 5-kinase
MSQENSRATLAHAHRLVVKLGTAVVTTEESELAAARVTNLVQGIAAERQAGREVVLVTSGAVGMGMRRLGLRQRPRSLGLRQACAAVGQGQLMAAYAEAFAQQGLVAAQVLLTQEDLGDRDRALCVRTTLMRLLELGAVPVLNENDSVSIRELVEYQRRQGGDTPARVFGDNDGLAARVAVALDADLLVLLTNVDGLFTANPKVDPGATRIPLLAAVDREALAAASGSSRGGTGGMASKLEAARLATAQGTCVVIANGSEPAILAKILAGEDVGTLVPTADARRARLRFIAVASKRFGVLVVNDGALAALEKGKASLLPVGVIAVEGSFDKGDVVEIHDGSGRVRGRGMVNYDADACRKLAGRQSDEIDAVLGYRGYDALVTRDNLVMGTTS